MRTYTPAEAARESGFSLDTLRYYESEGILSEVPRTGSGHRAYSEQHLGTLAFLRCLRDTGMPISLMRRYGQLCQDESTLPERLALLEEHSRAVERQIQTLRSQRTRLEEKVGYYRDEVARRSDGPAEGRRPASDDL